MRKKMNIRNTALRIVLGTMLIAGLAGCASTYQNAENEEELTGIRWLTSNLQSEGIAVVEHGSADLRFPAESSSRLVLIGRDVVDVYTFYERFTAADKAFEFAGRNPQNDVYLRGNLVVIRQTERDTGIRLTLHELLGKAL